MASIALEATLDPDPIPSNSEISVAEFEKYQSSSSLASSENLVTTAVEDDWVYPHPTDFTLTERPIDAVRELKVAVIGAGLTGEATLARDDTSCH